MENNFFGTNTVVRQVKYTNENELHAAIENVLDSGGACNYKLSHVMPISSESAYLIFEPDSNKMVVAFIDISNGKKDGELIFPYAVNEDITTMSLAEIELLRKIGKMKTEDKIYDVEGIDIEFSPMTDRMAFVYVRNTFADIPEYPEPEEK